MKIVARSIENAYVSNTLLLDGVYPATVVNVSHYENAFGSRFSFDFLLHGSCCAGEKLTKTTSANLSPKSKLAEILQGLLGRRLSDDEMSQGIDLEELIGLECAVLVGQEEKGGKDCNVVERVFRQFVTC